MQNKVVKMSKCTIEDMDKCPNIMAKREWFNGERVCNVLRPIDCPYLICDGAPCFHGTTVDTNADEVVFPCSKCEKPNSEFRTEARDRFIQENTK